MKNKHDNCKHTIPEIVILDSGISAAFLKKYPADVFGGTIDKGKYIAGVFDDNYGHGTAVYSLLNALCSSAKITVIKIYDRPETLTEQAIEDALEYIDSFLECDLVHMSLGTTAIPSKKIQELCSRLDAKGITIVAAMDNLGAMSYPAALPSVIGVQESNHLTRGCDFGFVEAGEINLLAKGGLSKIRWTDPQSIVVQGNSFSAVYATARATALITDGVRGRRKILREIKRNASFTLHAPRKRKEKNCPFFIKKAAVFPCSKETENLVLQRDMLPFAVTGLYDVAISGKVGKKIDNEFMVEDIRRLWDSPSFDTLILGYTDSLTRHKPELRKNILENCLEKKINVFFLEQLPEDEPYKSALREAGLRVYTPKITREDIPVNRFGRLFKISTPTVAVLGTGSGQGKFTLQMALWRILKRDYEVGLVGTEPIAPLFGMDFCFPMGYHGAVLPDGYANIAIINQAMHKMDGNKDIILTAGQYGVVPFDFSNVNQHTALQYDFLMGIHPEITILTVNPFDSEEYIFRTISVIESAAESKVIAIVPFPFTMEQERAGGFFKKKHLSKSEYTQLCRKLEASFHRSVFSADEPEKIAEHIIQYFEED